MNPLEALETDPIGPKIMRERTPGASHDAS